MRVTAEDIDICILYGYDVIKGVQTFAPNSTIM